MNSNMNPKICVTIGNCSVEECISSLKGLEMAEIRMDLMKVSSADVNRIFSQPVKLIATCRPDKIDDEGRKALLIDAINAGAAYADVEVEASDAYKQGIVEKAKSKGCKIIVSYHNYDRTPPTAELEQIVNWCFESGADIAKIACKSNSERDNARLLGLLGSDKKIIAIGMGEKGRITRIVAPLLGSPFTYASLGKGKETAEGQMDLETLKEKMKLLD